MRLLGFNAPSLCKKIQCSITLQTDPMLHHSANRSNAPSLCKNIQCSITLQKDPMLHHSAKRWKTVYAVISVVLLRRISMFGLYIRFTVCCCMIRSKVNYGPNRTSMVNRILPFCRKNRGPGFKSRSELCFLLFHPKCFVCISFYTERLSYTSEVCK